LPLTIARAEEPPDPDELGIRQRLDLDVNDDLTLLGVNLDTAQVRPGERVHLTLFWQTTRDPGASPAGQRAAYAVHLFLQDVEGDDVSLYRGEPVHGTYPTSHWTEGEIVVDRLNPRLPLDSADAPPGDYALALEITAPSGETLLGPTVLGTIDLTATDRTFDVPAMGHTQVVTFADQIQILGYDVDLGNARPGGNVDLTLYWRALAEMDSSYTVFTHLLDSDGQKVAQQDNPPVNGTYPTTLWLPGEIIADPFSISIQADVGPGDYTINVGFYIAENGLRLADPVVLDTVVTIRP
jgi:hypothetical protein